jgi:large subunit ribosomal protein L9
MDILLVSDVDKLGKRGDKVSVKPGFARNYLLPSGVAVLPTVANVRRIEKSRRAWLAEEKKIVEQARKLAEILKPVSLTIVEKSSDEGRLYGSVNDKVVAGALAKEGFELDSKVVRLDAPIREIGNYEVRIHLHSDVEVFIPLKVRAEGFEDWEPGQSLKKKVEGAGDAPKS